MKSLSRLLVVGAFIVGAHLGKGADLFTEMHSRWSNEPQWDVELKEIASYNGQRLFDGVSLGWAASDYVKADGTVMNFAVPQVRMILGKVKANGLKLHIELYSTGATGTPVAAINRWNETLINEAVAVFGPSELTFSSQNEPKPFSLRQVDSALIAHFNHFKAFWNAPTPTGSLKTRGYVFYGPALHGWHEWPPGAGFTAGYELFSHLAFYEWVYKQPAYWTALQTMGANWNIYVTGDPAVDSTIASTDKLDALLETQRRRFPGPMPMVGEFHVMRHPMRNDFSRWSATGRGLAAMRTRPVGRVTLYVWNVDDEEAIRRNDGTRNDVAYYALLAGLGKL